MKGILRYTVTLLCVVTVLFFGYGGYLAYALPEHYYLTAGHTLTLPHGVTLTPASETVQAGGGSGAGTRNIVQLLGIIPIREITVQTIPEVSLIPCGNPFGIKMLTEGVIVVAFGEIETADGEKLPAKDAGIAVGDILREIDGTPVNSNEEVAACIAKSAGKTVAVQYLHNGESRLASVSPALDKNDGVYKAGVWVRDSSAGIGTVTFFNPKDNTFGGLGHAICDVDTGDILPLLTGDVVDVSISGIIKGAEGSAGELQGSFLSETAVGTILKNSETGVFGRLYRAPSDREAIPVGLKQEVVPGPASILTTVAGQKPQEYEVEIKRVSLREDNLTKNMVLKITDPRLLDETGGIVQGMSGSPIIQNGKLIGAVTHVFLNDPTEGYGIFLENMYAASESLFPS